MKTTAIIPVFHVTDVPVAVRFYTQVLGFAESFSFGTYVGLKLGDHEIHLTTPGDYQRAVGGGNAYIIVDDVDAYYAAACARGAQARSAPTDRAYCMRDFVLNDPDGNQLSFGKTLED